MIARPSGGYDYSSDPITGWPAAQLKASTMHTLLTQVYQSSKDPDLYNMGQVYNANSWDLYNGLLALTTGGSFPIPASKILVTELATLSSLGPGSLSAVGSTMNAEAAAALFYVSPTQINLQVPPESQQSPGVGVVVSTAAGNRPPISHRQPRRMHGTQRVSFPWMAAAAARARCST